MELNESESIKEHLNILTMYEERLSLFTENKFSDIYFASFINMLNLNITAFFSIDDKKAKKSTCILRYRYYFKEKFNTKIARNVSKKDKIRFITFRLQPMLYKWILLASRRKLLRGAKV